MGLFFDTKKVDIFAKYQLFVVLNIFDHDQVGLFVRSHEK